MPYSNNEALPASVRGAIPSKTGQNLFRQVVNSQLRNGKSESVAFASAWSALQNAGYHQKDGKWVKKNNPTADAVHVPSTNMKKPSKKPKKEKKPDLSEAFKSYGAKPVYGYRPVLNAEEILDWAKSQGFEKCMSPDELHTTVVYSKRGFSPQLTMQAEADWDDDDHYGNIVLSGGERSLSKLGDNGAVVLGFTEDRIRNEHDFFRSLGAKWDYPDYKQHVTLTYQGAPEDLDKIEPYSGDIVFGPMRFRPLEESFDPNSIEHVDLNSFDMRKYQFHRDAYTMPAEAMVASEDMGLGGAYHVHEIDGQGMYMPGESHEDYLRAIGAEVSDPEPEQADSSALEMFMDRLFGHLFKGKEPKVPKEVAKVEEVPEHFFEDPILKIDDEKRIVWGWASVTAVNGKLVRDLHGDVILTETMVNAADEFMMHKRTAKAMHDGNSIGFVLHSFPFTKELGDALGIQSEMEGWVIAMKILDEDYWRRVKSGEFRGFSIGGKGKRVQIA